MGQPPADKNAAWVTANPVLPADRIPRRKLDLAKMLREACEFPLLGARLGLGLYRGVGKA